MDVSAQSRPPRCIGHSLDEPPQLRPVFLAPGLGSLCPLGCEGFGRGLK